MGNETATVIGVSASVLVATGIACAFIGVQGLLVALICLCAIECYMLITDGWYESAALIAVVAAVALFGLNPVIWLGVASVAVCITVIVAVIVGSL